jgi:hypothetical protein
MTRGATLYDRRSMPLAIPNGTLANPALRFKSRSGFYRLRAGADAGSVGFAINTFEVLKMATTQTVIRSSDAAATSIPLRITRATPSAVDGHEVALDIYDGGTAGGRLGVYRATSGQYGFKWYGRDSTGLHATPAMTLTNTKDLHVGGSLAVFGTNFHLLPAAGVATALLRSSEANQNTQLLMQANGGAQQAILAFQGGPSAWGINVAQGDVALYTVQAGALRLGTGHAPRLTINGAGASTFHGPLTVGGNLNGTGTITTTSSMHATAGISTNGSFQTSGGGVNIESTSGLASLTFQPWATGPQLGSSWIIFASAQPAPERGFITYQGSTAGFGLGGGVGSLGMYTNSATGSLILGTNNTARLHFLPNGDANWRIGPNVLNFVRDNGSILATLSNPGFGIHGNGPADPNGSWPSNLLVLNAKAGTTPGIAFHREGVVAPVLYEQGNLPYWNGAKMWTDANNIAPAGITSAQIANNTITEGDIAVHSMSAEILTQHSIHRPLAVYGGPAAQQDIPPAAFAGGTWVAVPQLTTPTFNPNSWYYYQVWAQVQVTTSSAGGRVKARIVFRDTAGLRTAFESGYTTSFSQGGWFNLTPIGVFNGAWLTGAFRVEVYTPDVVTVTVFAGLSYMFFWEMRR